jgi:hypothetical protein
MTKEQPIAASICEPCALILANDDETGMSASRAYDIRNRIESERMMHYTFVVDSFEPQWTSKACELCRNTQAGNRYAAAIYYRHRIMEA